MIESILQALVQLFALISDIHDISEISTKERDIVKLFLSRQLNKDLVNKYMDLFDKYSAEYSAGDITRGSLREKKRTSLTGIKILGICEKINEELHQKQKIYVIVQLLDFIMFGVEISENTREFIETVSIAFNIPQDEFLNLRNFIFNSVNEVPEKKRVLVIDSKTDPDFPGVKHLQRETLKNSILLLHIESINSYVLRYTGKEDLFLNGQNIYPEQTYMFDHGATIRDTGINTIYFNDVTSVFSRETFKQKVYLDATDVNMRFKNSDAGIQNFSFHEESGNLVGIMGGSGVGKTTLLNVLSGITKPQTGKVLINGYDLYSVEGRASLKGVIGFVPQDDLLIEELSVYQNLYYSSKMCLDNLGEDKLVEVVNRTLAELDLNEIRDLKVGNSLNKVISGGQRKRLNIALELIREPTILFVDEPTSGLSSVDSETVMNLLKQQSNRGKLILINIHQPGSDIYKMFDKIIIIDKGGYQIFYGNPSEAIVYFKSEASYANADEDQCPSCGNINSDQLLQIIEAKVVDEKGKQTHIRKVAPREWAEKFSLRKQKQAGSHAEKPLPENFYSIPGYLKQSGIFFTRDVLSKLTNNQYVIISFLGAPLLAFLLSYFTRYSVNGTYVFSENDNLPSYMFMCVITSLFLGLMISAEEIVKDRRILKRESFLNLSWFSYLNSKTMLMFLISAIQTISFILIGNFILEIKGMTLPYWFALFTTACFANMLGLNISSAFNSVITIYILIPFIIIPQLLFSGVIVKFYRLHSNSNTSVYVPVIGEIMATRWSFEALAVEQFKNNRYNRNVFIYNMEKSQYDWYSSFLINELKDDLYWSLKKKDDPLRREMINNNLYKVNYYTEKLGMIAGFKSKGNLLNIESFDSAQSKAATIYLDSIYKKFRKIVNVYTLKIDTINSRLIEKLGKNALDENDSFDKGLLEKTGKTELARLKENYQNNSLEEVVTDQIRTTKFLESDKKILQTADPVYMKPESKFGRAHLYAPYKLIGNLKIDTYVFDLMVLWIVTMMLYMSLYYKLPEKLIQSFENLRFKFKDKK